MPDNAASGTSVGDRPWDHRAAWVLFAVLTYFPLFLNLDVMPLRQWDESRQAISAYEMLHNGNWLVNHFYGSPDMWSTKPPLLVWIQALFMKMLGPGELAVRLPAAISALLIGFLLMWVCARWLRKPWMGLIANLVLFTSEGFLYHHAARHGDYDVPMTLFMLLQAVALFRFSMNGSRRAIVLFCVGFTGAVLTKSIQGLLYLPGLAIFLLATGSWRSLMRQRTTWIGMGIGVALIATFYLARESANPGYIDAVITNELGDRYNTVIEGHVGPWDLYLDRFIRWNFTTFYLLVPVGLVIGLSFRDALHRRWGILVASLAVTYLFVISKSSTKCEWYDVPAYPLLAMLTAFVIHAVFQWAAERKPLEGVLTVNVIPAAILFLLFASPYYRVTNKAYLAQEWDWDKDFYAPAYYFKEVLAGKHELKADVLSNDCYDAHLYFYMNLINEKGQRIRGVSKHDLQPGMKVMAFEPFPKEVIERDYDVRLIEEWYGVRVYEILARRQAP